MEEEYKIEIKQTQIQEREKQISYVSNIKQVINPQLMSFNYNEKEDIIKNIYEGGFKLWECTIDMLQYLQKMKNSNILSLEGKNIVDVGCGHGLLGIYALQENSQSVAFLDYNKEVLDMVTQKNIELNFSKNDSIANKVVFLSGDWLNIPQKIQAQQNEIEYEGKLQSYNQKFDIVMMSEVIYNVENYKKVTDLLISILEPENGICLMANKLFYFGCGGSTPEYKEYLQNNYSEILQWETAELINNKKGNKREILAIRFIKK